MICMDPRDRLAVEEFGASAQSHGCEARPVRFTRVAHHVEVFEVFPLRQMVHAGLGLVDVDEINSEI